MFNHTHYVPVLKGKGGEYGALESLANTVKMNLTPLIEIPSIPWDFENDEPAKSVDSQLKTVAQKISKCWGNDRPVFVDLLWIPNSEKMKDGRHPLEYIADEARKHNIQLIPVTGLNRDKRYQEAIADAVVTDRHGVCIRLENDDFENINDLQVELNTLLKSCKISAKEADLIFDFKEVSEGQTSAILIATRSMLSNLPTILDWRTITFLGSAFPENLSSFSSGSTNRRSRTEWNIWTALANNSNKIPRLPTFGDYAVAHPELIEVDPRLMRMSANLRYTTLNNWIIIKGRNVRDYGYEQFNDLCRILVMLPEFCGKDFSWGDAYIAKCATDKEGPGSATTWRKVGTSHHLSFMTTVIASFLGI